MRNLLIVIAVALVLFMAMSMSRKEDDKAFMQNASRIAGHIVSKEENITSSKRELWVTYSYSDQKGDTHITKARMDDEELWKRFREGTVEMVYYDKTNPSKSYLAVVLDKKVGKK